jgi:hypothetical protein
MAKKKSPSADDEFETIANRAIEEADAVECSYTDYVAGLHDMATALTDHWNVAKNELEKKQRQSGSDEEE